MHRYLASAPGQALMAIKTNETRLEYLGVSARTHAAGRLRGLGHPVPASAAPSWPSIQGLVTPDFGYWVRSGEFVFIAILGGTGHVVGAFAGALVYELVAQPTRPRLPPTSGSSLSVCSCSLIILFASRGLVGLYQDLMGRVCSDRRRDARPAGSRPG